MTTRIGHWALPLALPVAIGLNGCLADWDGEGGADAIGGTPAYQVSGDLQGLSGGQVAVTLNGSETLTLDSNGEFNFQAELDDGVSYQVAVTSQPADQVCSVSNGSGTISGADVTSVLVECEQAYHVSGSVSGLEADPVILSLNGAESVTVDQDGGFDFDTRLPDGASYEVTVDDHPGDSAFCELSNASGTISGSDVSNISVSCQTIHLGAVTDQQVVHLDWSLSGMVDVVYSTDHQCDWVNVSNCENGSRVADVSGGSLSLSVGSDGLQPDATYTFVLEKAGQTSPRTVATPASFHLNDLVRETVIEGDHVFAAGDFTHYAADTGGHAVLRGDLPEADQTGTVPEVRGNVWAIAEAPDGGWYIGGNFDRVHGEARDNIARLNPDGTLDTSWNASVAENGFVNDLAVTADRVYIGGAFADVAGNTDHANVAALKHDGNLDTAFKPEKPSQTVWAVVEENDLVYIGGDFVGYGPDAQDYIVALDPADGSVHTGFKTNVDSNIREVTPIDGDRLALGGVFSQVGGQNRENIAVVQQGSGDLDTAFDANITMPVYVQEIVSTDKGLLLAGPFSEVDGNSRPGLARVDAGDGSLDIGWNPDFDSGSAFGIAMGENAIYAAGQFQDSAGNEYHLQKLDPTDGLSDSDWQPDLADNAYAVITDGTDVHVGGRFNSVHGTPVDYFAAFDLQDGSLDTDWDPAFDAPVHALTIGDSGLFVGGAFTEVTTTSGNTLAHAHATAFHLSDGTDRGWQPQPDSNVHALDMRDDETAVYMGGRFNTIKGQSFQGAAVVDVLKGDPLASATDPEVSYKVNSVVHAPDATGVLLGGQFSQVGSTARDNAAFLDEDDLTLRNFTPDPDDVAWATEYHNFSGDNRYFLGGDFLNIAGQAHEYFGIVDGNSSLVTTFEFDGPVRAIDFLASEQRLLVGGAFETVLDGGSATGDRFNFAAMDYDGSNLSLRTEDVALNGRVHSIDQTAGHIVVGGEFSTVASEKHGRLVVLDASTLEPIWTGTDLSTASHRAPRKVDPRGGEGPEPQVSLEELIDNPQ